MSEKIRNKRTGLWRTRLWGGTLICGALLALAVLRPAADTQGITEAQARTVTGGGAGVSFSEGFADLAEKLLPTVVNISTTQKIEQPQRPPQLPQLPPGSPFEDMFRDFFEHFENMPQMPGRQMASLGSGFVIDAENGYIVTNNHVIKDSDEIKVILHDDTSLDAKIIGMDDKTDIAVLQIETDRPLTAAVWGDSDTARVGHWVLAIGNPFGLGGTVTTGIISANRRDINAGPYDDFIQTDAAINRGNSGGPMFNLKGEVIGVNTAIFSPTGGSVGIGFAVPSTLAQNVVRQLIEFGQTRRGWLGVRIQEVTEDIAESLGLKEKSGALVSSVTKGSPAEKAGLQAGDVILRFDGRKVAEMRHLPRMVAESEVDREVDMTVFRQGREIRIKVTLGQLEEAEEKGLLTSGTPDDPKTAAAEETKIDALGLTVAPLTQELRQRFKLDRNLKGLVITTVDPSGPAAGRAIATGDVITEAGQKSVESVATLEKIVEEALKSGNRSVLLLISRGGDLRFVAVRLREADTE
ncbi:MAG: DegQ family serine endoprotease [Micavibrio sp.]|nr:MAG: DegQ family serine endoprotease [Micavibrio sp.]